MPDRIVRRYLEWSGDHDEIIKGVLLVALLLMTMVAFLGWNSARNAQQRVTSVETQLAAEQVGKAIADVTTCFNSADRRPQLETILRGIASELQPDPRAALNGYIDQYTKNTPTREDCVKLAEKNGLDPQPYLNNPPSEAGNQEGS